MSVYFIRPIGMAGPVKIGTSRSPDKRLTTLATWSPFPLEIVCSIEGGYRLEQQFHTKFFDLHINREWFRWTPELELTMQSIIAGTFDYASLPEGREGVRKKAIHKDMSFATPGFRYARSVQQRLLLLRRNHGMPWREPGEMGLSYSNYGWRFLTDVEVEAHKAEIEPKIAALKAKYAGQTRASQAAAA